MHRPKLEARDIDVGALAWGRGSCARAACGQVLKVRSTSEARPAAVQVQWERGGRGAEVELAPKQDLTGISGTHWIGLAFLASQKPGYGRLEKKVRGGRRNW